MLPRGFGRRSVRVLIELTSLWLAVAAEPPAGGPPTQTTASPATAAEHAAVGGELSPDPETATRARANLVSLFSTDDYPPEAWRNGEQGTVAVKLTVGPDGKVADCIVTHSSGSPSLDVQTCRILWTRAQFSPARDAEGNPVRDTYNQRIRWELPTGSPVEVEEQFFRYILIVDAKKAILSCRYESSPDWQRGDSACSEFIERVRHLVTSAPEWIDFSGKEMVMETQHRVGEPQGGTDLGERPGERSIALSRLYLTIDGGGKVKSCSRDSWGAVREGPWIACGAAERWQFEGLPKEESNKSDRQMTIVNAIYLRAATALR